MIIGPPKNELRKTQALCRALGTGDSEKEVWLVRAMTQKCRHSVGPPSCHRPLGSLTWALRLLQESCASLDRHSDNILGNSLDRIWQLDFMQESLKEIIIFKEKTNFLGRSLSEC